MHVIAGHALTSLRMCMHYSSALHFVPFADIEWTWWRFLGVAEHHMTLDNEHKEREE